METIGPSRRSGETWSRRYECACVENIEDWRRLYDASGHLLEVERLIGAENRALEDWHFVGFCEVCDRASRFSCDWQSSGDSTINFRERLRCERCGLNCRQRLVFQRAREVLAQRSGPRAVYAYEKVTRFYQKLAETLVEQDVVGSEYLGHEHEPGAIVNGIQHEDALALSFSDRRFDLLISNDVFEHVPDPGRALAEANRVLCPGGSMIATIPFTFRETTVRRARLVDGRVEHELPPVYHGNPVSSTGSLVFNDFGWDFLDTCRAAGFSNVRFLCTHSMLYGYMGSELGFVLRADKSE